MSKISNSTRYKSKYKDKTVTDYGGYCIDHFARHEGKNTAQFIEKWNKKLNRKGVSKHALFVNMVKGGHIKILGTAKGLGLIKTEVK